MHASRHGARVGPAAFGLTGVRGRSEAWTGDIGLHGRRGPGARRAEKARRTAGGRRPGGGAELGLGPADCALLPGGLRGDSTLTAPPASWRLPRPQNRDLVKGLALFFLCSSPAPEASVHLSAWALLLQRPRRSEPGALEVPVFGGIFPSLPCPPLYAVGAPPVLSLQGLGPGLGLPFSSPRQRQALWCRKEAPRSPRQVREGCVD